MSFVYIANPYMDEDEEVIAQRVASVTQYTAYLMMKHVSCYSPIVHGHAVQDYLPKELQCCHKFWLNHDFDMLKHARAMHLLAIDGWQRSRGCKWEYETAKVFNIPVSLVIPEPDGQYHEQTLGVWPHE
jgi:hypothetical protein